MWNKYVNGYQYSNINQWLNKVKMQCQYQWNGYKLKLMCGSDMQLEAMCEKAVIPLAKWRKQWRG